MALRPSDVAIHDDVTGYSPRLEADLKLERRRPCNVTSFIRMVDDLHASSWNMFLLKIEDDTHARAHTHTHARTHTHTHTHLYAIVFVPRVRQ